MTLPFQPGVPNESVGARSTPTPQRRIRLGLAAKLAICLVASTAAFFALFGYLSIREQRRHSEGLLMQAAERISDVIMRSTHYEMLHNDRSALYNVIREMSQEPGIRRIRILNKEGRISFSTDHAEVNTVVDKRAEACYGCHAQEQPLTKLPRPDRARMYRDAEGQRVLGVIRPIENQPVCSSAECHAHSPDKRVLGVIDANLSLAGVDEQISEFQLHLVWAVVAAVLLISLVSASFIWLFVYRPVKELMDGTHRVAGGDLDYRLPVHSKDELGDLAASFNKMTAEVAGVQAEIEERVRLKTVELERAHRAILTTEKLASIGKLAATVAHEINNPLFGILTYARLILRDVEKSEMPAKDEVAEQLRTIERESRRCGDLVKNLLTFARQAPSRREPKDARTLVERAVALVRHKLELQNIELVENLVEDAPPVMCDAGQIQQVILVLLVNAADAMPQGGRLEVATEIEPDGEHVRVRVRDSGMGIPADVLPQIFDPFFTTKEDQQRTGLGLAVARSIVEQHGGEIVVHSSPGEGTEFVVLLPVAALAAAETVKAG
ncbi:MAG TPA: ATP-binding protein [Bryobacteraceae bacterium]|nr:ATP-binding protein [Bryobacteraceae bacterium]